MALTDRRELFCREYLLDLNATQAAIRAGYSAETAQEQSSRLLSNDMVQARVSELQAAKAKKLDISSERVLAEIARMAFYDPIDLMVQIEASEAEAASGAFIAEDGKLYGLRGPTDIRSLPEDVRRAIVGWSWDKAGNFTVKLADKSKALDQLARHLSLYNDKLEVSGLDALAERLARASQRNGDDA